MKFLEVVLGPILPMLTHFRHVSLFLHLVLAVIYGLITSVVLAVKYLMDPGKFTKWDQHPRPTVLDAKNYGKHETINLSNGNRMYYMVSGEGNKLMVVLPGFLSFWYSHRHQIMEFKKDYLVVTIDPRRYGPNGIIVDRSVYDLGLILNDIRLVIDTLGDGHCVLCGHECGGLLAWAFTQLYPDYVDKLVIMNAPHPKLYTECYDTNSAQFLKGWYLTLYALPYLAELYLKHNDYEKVKARLTAMPPGVKNRNHLPDEDIEAFVYNASSPGTLTAMLNFYRTTAHELRTISWGRIDCPTLVLWGDNDAFLELVCLNGLFDRFTANVKIQYVSGAGHWVQHTQPQIVNRIMRSWLIDSDKRK